MIFMAKEKVVICDHSWAGMNSVILPRVKLGTRTIVAAGSVAAKSFPEGYCVIAGSPAKIIRYLDKEKLCPGRMKKNFMGLFQKMYLKKIPSIR